MNHQNTGFNIPNYEIPSMANNWGQMNTNIMGNYGMQPQSNQVAVPGSGVMRMPGNNADITGGGGGGPEWSRADRLYGATDADGNSIGGSLMPALQVGTGLLQGYLGMKQYGLAREQFEDSKDQFAANYENQRKMTNSQLRDRQGRRAAANSGTESPDSYMNRNEIEAY